MAKKGSITVFLALILSLLLSLVGTSIQSVQAAAARTQILSSWILVCIPCLDSMIPYF